VDFGVRYAEYSVEKEITGFFDFSGAKKKFVQRAFDEFSMRVKKKIFPVLSEQLISFKDSLDVRQLQKDLLADRNLLIPEIGPFSEQLLSEVGPDEYAQLLLHYGEKIEDGKETLSKPDEFRKQEKKKILRGLEYFLDPLTPDQQQQVDNFIAKENFPYALQIKNQEHCLELLKATTGNSQSLKILARRYIDDPAAVELEAFRQAREVYFEDLASLIADLLAKATPEQKHSAGLAAASLAKDLQELQTAIR
jgi:hypothetical protein